ncbi:MAG: PIN domain-containing protein [Myxococcota bacterium]
MKRVLVDTGPLVAMCDERDALHARAMKELAALKAELVVTLPVLTEALHLLVDDHLRRRLHETFARGLVLLSDSGNEVDVARKALDWMARYADHAPDFTDAFLICSAEADAALSIWTFDRAFRTVWRFPSGRKLRLAPK